MNGEDISKSGCNAAIRQFAINIFLESDVSVVSIKIVWRFDALCEGGCLSAIVQIFQPIAQRFFNLSWPSLQHLQNFIVYVIRS